MPQPELFADDPDSGIDAALRHHQPLAERMRPRALEDFCGQDHLLDPGKPLRRVLESGRAHSMVLWGPPGTGKTTLARLIALRTRAQFLPLSAVLAGVKDIREAAAKAKLHRDPTGGDTILFVDEAHLLPRAGTHPAGPC